MIAGVLDLSGRGSLHERLAGFARTCTPALEVRRAGPMAVAAPPASFGMPSDAGLVAVDGRIAGRDADGLLTLFAQASGPVGGDLRGAFAAVTWDERRGTGALLRDPMGVQPLFAAGADGALVFASEVRDVLVLLPRRPGPDRAAILDLLADRPAAHERTLYEGVAPVPPGQGIALDRRGWRRMPRWAPAYRTPDALTMAEAAARVRGTLSRLVDRDTSGRATGVMLSGGLDSSSVAGVARPVHPNGTLKAFSLVFPEQPETDEEELILVTSRALGIPSTRAAVTDGSPLEQALRFLDAWKVLPQTMNGFILAPIQQAARRSGTTVMLDGEGGDELFELSPWLIADLLKRGSPRSAMAMTRRIAGAGTQSQTALARYLLSTTLAATLPRRRLRALRRPTRFFSAPPAWLDEAIRRRLTAVEDPFAWRALDGPSWWAQQAYLLTQQRQELGYHDQLRRQLAMQDLVGSHPLLDLDAVEQVLTLPPQLAFDPTINRPLLREVAAGAVPDEVRLRKRKSYFDPVLEHCFPRNDLAVCRRVLQAPEAETAAYVRREAVDDLLERAACPNPASAVGDVWRLTMAELWLRTQRDGGLAARMLAEEGLPQTEIQWRSTGV